jgi:hypothetical protein
MAKKIDNVQLYASLRKALEQERAGIQARLRSLEKALGSNNVVATTAVALQPGPWTPSETAPRMKATRRAKRPQNTITLRDAVARVTAKKPLGIADIVERVQGIGYVFASKNPRNSLGAYLYGPAGKRFFGAEAGRFYPLN